MAITKVQVIDTVLMRYGNRQGNAALQTQALIEWDLLFDELYEMPKLPNFLKDAYDAAITYNYDHPDTGTFPSVITTIDAKQYGFDRFVDQDNNPPPFRVLSIYNGSSMAPAYKKLLPLSAEEYTEKLVEENGVPTRGPLTHYFIESGTTAVSAGHLTLSQKVRFWPVAEMPEEIWLNGYRVDQDLWRANCPQLIISGLGMRMGPYVKDAEELARFQQDFYRQLDSIYKRDVSIEQDSKYGNRGEN